MSYFFDWDSAVLKFCASIAHQHRLFNGVVVLILSPDVANFSPLVAWLWFLWFSRDRQPARKAVVTALLGACLALVVSRVVQDLAPERPRPLYSGNPDSVAPYFVGDNVLRDWSSFPSDHAAMAFGLATGLLLVSRLAGWTSMVWSVVVVCLPRISAGYHYASDVVAGAIVGALSTVVVSRSRAVVTHVGAVSTWLERRSPGLFYALVFLASMHSRPCSTTCA